MVGYHYDTDCIFAKQIKNRQSSMITKAWQLIHNDFKKTGTALTTYVLDNETSKELMDGFDKERISYQLVTPYKHRNNQAKRAIQTFKAHFKAALAMVDPNFSLSE